MGKMMHPSQPTRVSERYIAVSYTHLDVYKRQVIYSLHVKTLPDSAKACLELIYKFYYPLAVNELKEELIS